MTESPRCKEERAVAIAELQALIDEGLASGISTRTFDEIIEDARQLLEDVAPVYEAMKADPSRAIPAAQVFDSLRDPK